MPDNTVMKEIERLLAEQKAWRSSRQGGAQYHPVVKVQRDGKRKPSRKGE